MTARTGRGRVLAVYTGATIAAGFGAFAWAAATYPIDPAISLTETGGREGILLGLVFWVVLGLLGGTRVERLGRYGALTFHLPFIIAAMALGGPTAGAVVAMISTIERRELREVPWYGLLANHAAVTLGAVLGGVALLATTTWLQGFGVDGAQAIELASIAVGSLVLAVVSTGLAVGTVVIRDGLGIREATVLHDLSYRATSASEVILGWVLTFAYAAIGWWAALVCAMLVLVIWQAHDDRERVRHEPMTGLLTRTAFDARLSAALDAAARRGRSAALLAIDLDGFKAVNDTHGHAAGDAVIAAVGDRLRMSIRLSDAAVRLGGDEFGVLLTDVADESMATMLAWRLHATLCEPVDLDDRTIAVGASIGLYPVRPAPRQPSVARAHDLADVRMYEAKRSGGGVCAARPVRGLGVEVPSAPDAPSAAEP